MADIDDIETRAKDIIETWKRQKGVVRWEEMEQETIAAMIDQDRRSRGQCADAILAMAAGIPDPISELQRYAIRLLDRAADMCVKGDV